MVAIKAAHISLNARDLWPGLPWDWKDTHRIQDECRQRAIDSGVTEEPYVSFAAAREWEKYLQSFPRLSERQKILNKIYPMVVAKRKSTLELSDEELDYLIDKLFGVNDPIGHSALEKLRHERNR